MPAWPTTLPDCPVLGSFNMQPEGNIDEFQPQDGNEPLRRQRYTGRTFIYTGELVLPKLWMMEELDTFHGTTCKDGALSFTMPDWRDHVSRTFTWVQPPTYARGAGGVWRASLVLRRSPLTGVGLT